VETGGATALTGGYTEEFGGYERLALVIVLLTLGYLFWLTQAEPWQHATRDVRACAGRMDL
jgi:hypothetical protein